MTDSNPVALHVLFLCTGNSARSVLAEAILARLGESRFRSFSAGSAPKSSPHPVALATLEGHGYDTTGLRSQSWNDFAQTDSPRIDFVFTVCDNAAAETCPVWPGHPMTVHWGVRDPAAFEGSESDQRAFFEEIYAELYKKVEAFVALDSALELEHASSERLLSELRRIGERVG